MDRVWSPFFQSGMSQGNCELIPGLWTTLPFEGTQTSMLPQHPTRLADSPVYSSPGPLLPTNPVTSPAKVRNSIKEVV